MNVQILKDLMKEVNGASFVSIDTLTDVKLLGGKKNPMIGRVTKRGVGHSVMVFQNKKTNGYEAMVQRRLEKEGKNPESFTLGPRQWGTRITDTPFVEHNGQTYLEVIFLKSGKVDYLVDGQEFAGEIEGLATVQGCRTGRVSNHNPRCCGRCEGPLPNGCECND